MVTARAGEDVKQRKPHPPLAGTSMCSHRGPRLAAPQTGPRCDSALHARHTPTRARTFAAARSRRLPAEGPTNQLRHNHTWMFGQRGMKSRPRYNLENTAQRKKPGGRSHVLRFPCMKHPGQGSRRHGPRLAAARGRWAGTGGDASRARGVFVG